jgi:hypothetical protein
MNTCDEAKTTILLARDSEEQRSRLGRAFSHRLSVCPLNDSSVAIVDHRLLFVADGFATLHSSRP